MAVHCSEEMLLMGVSGFRVHGVTDCGEEGSCVAFSVCVEICVVGVSSGSQGLLVAVEQPFRLPGQVF